MRLKRFLTYIQSSSTKPAYIQSGQWRAMLKWHKTRLEEGFTHRAMYAYL